MAKFSLGAVVVTMGALSSLTAHDVDEALKRHLDGDWGELCDEDRRENDLSLIEGFRLLSAYRSASGQKFWIITEADRSVTTILLPDEY